MPHTVPGTGQAGRRQEGQGERDPEHAQHPARHVGEPRAGAPERLESGFVADQPVGDVGVGDLGQRRLAQAL